MSAQLVFRNDEDHPTQYLLDQIAAEVLDTKREHPEAIVVPGMPARDRAQAVAFLRMALDALDPGSTPKGGNTSD